jgi:predicted nucleotidyltransferase
MAFLDPEVRKRALDAVRILKRMATVRAAYVFGSHVEGRAHRYSDIDVALFAEGVENWDIQRRARAMAQVQKEAGLEVEAHLFPASSLDHREPGSFAAWVLAHGVEVHL